MKAADNTIWLLVAGSGSLSSTTQPHRVAATGYRNRQHFETATHFQCGRLSFYPATHGILG